VVAALLAIVPLYALGAAAPGGGTWRWLALPRADLGFAAVLGIAACFARRPATALIVPLGTVGIALLRASVSEYAALRRFGRTDLFDLGLLADLSINRLAPWLLGVGFGVIAWLAIRRPGGEPRLRRRAAALWLAAVGALAVGLALANRSWYELASSDSYIVRSSVPWPDTKVIAVVIGAIACGVAAVVAWRTRRPGLPRATARPRR
jgi:hypothetical protein